MRQKVFILTPVRFPLPGFHHRQTENVNQGKTILILIRESAFYKKKEMFADTDTVQF